MTSANPTRVRDTVYVVGAGFSAGLGYQSLIASVLHKYASGSAVSGKNAE